MSPRFELGFDFGARGRIGSFHDEGMSHVDQAYESEPVGVDASDDAPSSDVAGVGVGPASEEEDGVVGRPVYSSDNHSAMLPSVSSGTMVSLSWIVNRNCSASESGKHPAIKVTSPDTCAAVVPSAVATKAVRTPAGGSAKHLNSRPATENVGGSAFVGARSKLR